MAITLIHQTPAQFAARFWAKMRAIYVLSSLSGLSKSAKSVYKTEYSKMIWWLYGKVQAGDLTTNDVRLSFNAAYGRALTVAQWSTFVTNTLKPIRDRYQAMLDEADL